MPLTYTSTSAPLVSGVKLAIYGPAGVGKTVLTATMPTYGPNDTLVLSAESGLLSLQPANQMRMFGRVRELPVAIINGVSDLEEAYQLLLGPHGRGIYNVGIDSASEIAEVCLARLLKLHKDPRKAYGELWEIMSYYIRCFRDLPGKNVYMTAKMDRDKDGDGVMLYGPSLPGKQLTQNFAHFFDEVFHLGIGTALINGQQQSYRYLRTRPNMQFSAKDRSGALLELEEPNLTNIIAKIQQK